MATVTLQPIAAALPKSKLAISSKREFEQIINQICRTFAASRSLASQNMDFLQARSQNSSISQKNWHLAGSIGEIICGPGAALITGIARYKGVNNAPEISKTFEIGLKIGEITKGLCGATQYSQRNEQEKIQYANSQWQTYAQGAQETIRNLKSGLQRLQQLEDASHR
jgi:hypothetical protein